MSKHHTSRRERADTERRRVSRAALIERLRVSLVEGDGLHAVAEREGLPLKTLRHWLAENADLREAYEQARDLRHEFLADDAVALADRLADASNAGLKLRIDARKWRVGLDRKDGKNPAATEKARNAEMVERLKRALERVRKQEEEEIRQRYGADDGSEEGNADEQRT